MPSPRTIETNQDELPLGPPSLPAALTPRAGKEGLQGGCEAAPAAAGEEIPQARKLASSREDGREETHGGGGRACCLRGLCALLARFCAAGGTPRLDGERSGEERERGEFSAPAPCAFRWGKCFPHPKRGSSPCMFPFSACTDPSPTFFLLYVFLNFYFLFIFSIIFFFFFLFVFRGEELLLIFFLLFFSFCVCVIFLKPVFCLLSSLCCCQGVS